MPSHVMLSYQWDDQELVKKIYSRLKEDGLPVWMDIEGRVSGNINDAMAAGVEDAAVICPIMTPAYQASRSCKKELNYADSREVVVVPVLLADNWEASEWLGLITAGLLWVDFRNADEDEEQFDKCLRSLEEEIMFNAGHLLTLEESQTEEVDQTKTPKHLRQKKPGRGFRHLLSSLYIESGVHSADDTRSLVQLTETLSAHCYWEEVKGAGCKRYRNVVTDRYLGFDPVRDEVHSDVSPSPTEEWLLLADQTDRSHRRVVAIKNKQSGRFLAVKDGCFTGLTSYDEACKWLLE